LTNANYNVIINSYIIVLVIRIIIEYNSHVNRTIAYYDEGGDMKRFSFEVKLFALDNRREGKGWGEIRRAIKENFLIEPPTIRAMQKWEQGSDREVLNSALKDKAKKEAEAIKEQTLNRVAQELLPKLWEARDTGEDVEYAGWSWFFSIMENTLGREKFRRFMARYLDEHKD
jgi:hypothetical protein